MCTLKWNWYVETTHHFNVLLVLGILTHVWNATGSHFEIWNHSCWILWGWHNVLFYFLLLFIHFPTWKLLAKYKISSRGIILLLWKLLLNVNSVIPHVCAHNLRWLDLSVSAQHRERWTVIIIFLKRSNKVSRPQLSWQLIVKSWNSDEFLGTPLSKRQSFWNSSNSDSLELSPSAMFVLGAQSVAESWTCHRLR